MGDLIVLTLIGFPILLGLYLAVSSTTIILGQIRRKELVSLKRILIVALSLLIFDAYFCINASRLAWLSQNGQTEALFICILVTVGLVICPYAGLAAYRIYQSQHREEYSQSQDVGVIAEPKGMRDATILTVALVGFMVAVLCAQYLPRYLMLSASKSGNNTVVQQLLQVGANPNVRTEGGMTPLAFACRNNDLQMVLVLLDHNADVNYCSPILPMQMASRHGDLQIFRLLLDRGVDPNAKLHSSTVLIAVAQEGTPDAVKLLLERGADVNGKTLMADTALMAASTAGHLETAKLLIEGGAEINVADRMGRTALLAACMGWRSKLLVPMLLEKGADTTARLNYNGRTPLMIASEQGQTEAVQALLAAGADVNAKDLQGNTALKLATDRGRKEVARILAEHGAEETR